MNKNPNALNAVDHQAAQTIPVNQWHHEAMEILIRTDGMELTDKLRTAVNRKIGRGRNYAPRALRARVQLRQPAPGRFQVKVHYEIPGNDLFAQHSAHEPLAALNLVAEKIEGRLRRRKTAHLAQRVREQRAQAHRWPAVGQAA